MIKTDRKFPHEATGGHRRGGLVGRVWATQARSCRLPTISPQGAFPQTAMWLVLLHPTPDWNNEAALGKMPRRSYLSWTFKGKYELSGWGPDIWSRGNRLCRDMKWEARCVPGLQIMEEGKRTGCWGGGWWWWSFRLSRWAGVRWWVVFRSCSELSSLSPIFAI